MAGLTFTAQVCYAEDMAVDLTVTPSSVDVGSPATIQIRVYDANQSSFKFNNSSVTLTIDYPNGRSSTVALTTDANGNRDYMFTPNVTGVHSFYASSAYNYTAAGFAPVGVRNATSLAKQLTVNPAPAATGTPSPAPGTADVTPPVTVLTVTGVAGSNGQFMSNVTINLTAQDGVGGSGVKAVQYSYDGGNWSNYTSPITIDRPGTTTLYYRSVDNAGNIEVAKTRDIVISNLPTATPPATSTPAPSAAVAVMALIAVIALSVFRRKG